MTSLSPIKPSKPLTLIRIYRSITRSDLLLDDRLEYTEEDFITSYELSETDARTLYILIKLHGYQGKIYLPEAIQALRDYAQIHRHGSTFLAITRLIDEIQNYRYF